MSQLLFLLNSLAFLLCILFFAVFSIGNFRKGYLRAGTISSVIPVFLVAVFLLFQSNSAFQSSVAIMSVSVLLLSLIPIPGYKVEHLLSGGDKRFDERDIPFARFRLKPGSEKYRSYYRENPEREVIDSRTRALPGLLTEGSRYFHRLNAAAGDASFFLLDQLKQSVDGPVSNVSQSDNTEQIARYLESLSELYGVSCYGVTKVKPVHYYSHIGRGTEYGTEIPVRHKYAIVFGSEMKSRLTATAPLSPEVVETGRRYVDCAVWAVQAASFIRNLGYSARAHIDGNYQLVAPLVANDAGLGGFGWSGLFLTGKYGPRVRFSVVTTDMELPLAVKRKQHDFLSFCYVCRKCAVNCPSRAISGEKLEKLNTDTCFMYWNAVGTDCGKCLAVCPMGHPWGALKTLAMRSRLAAMLLKRLDDVFYGRKPGSLRLPHWMEIG